MEGYKTEMEIVTLGRSTMKESTSFFFFWLSRLMNWKFWWYLSRICIAAPMWNVIPNVRIESTMRKIPKFLLKKKETKKERPALRPYDCEYTNKCKFMFAGFGVINRWTWQENNKVSKNKHRIVSMGCKMCVGIYTCTK